MGSLLIESAAYSNQILLAKSYLNNAQNTLVNRIIRLLLSLLFRPYVILLSGGLLEVFLSFIKRCSAQNIASVTKAFE
jgi:hypothetical protein